MKTDSSRAATAAGCHGAAALDDDGADAGGETTPLCHTSATPLPPTRSTLTQRVSWHARVTFRWVDYLVNISRGRAITADDVCVRQLDPQDLSEATHDALVTRLISPRDFRCATLRLHWRGVAASATLALVAAMADCAAPLLVYVAMNAVADQAASITASVAALALYGAKCAGILCSLQSKCICATVTTRTLGALETLTFDATLSASRASNVTVSAASTMFFELTASGRVR